MAELQRDFDAIAIGASAGGVEALTVLLQSLRRGFRPAILVVLHLPAQRPSLLCEVMARHCALPVREAVDKQPVAPGCVFIAPPDYHLLVEPQRTLALSVDPPVLHSRPAIDPLFESAALAYGRRLLALVLTGASADGSEGAMQVRRCGGTLWVQRPEDALMPQMPEAALQRAGADEVMSLQAMASRLASA